jgi:hypothetical protein
MPLNELEKVVLVKFNDVVGGSLNAHVPKPAIEHRFKTHVRGYVSKTLEKLRRKGLLQWHPTRGGVTYQLTREGRDLAMKLKAEL